MPAELIHLIVIITLATAIITVPWHVLPWLFDRIDRWDDRRAERAAAKVDGS